MPETFYMVTFAVQTRLEVNKTQQQKVINPGVDAGIFTF